MKSLVRDIAEQIAVAADSIDAITVRLGVSRDYLALPRASLVSDSLHESALNPEAERQFPGDRERKRTFDGRETGGIVRPDRGHSLFRQPVNR